MEWRQIVDSKASYEWIFKLQVCVGTSKTQRFYFKGKRKARHTCNITWTLGNNVERSNNVLGEYTSLVDVAVALIDLHMVNRKGNRELPIDLKDE